MKSLQMRYTKILFALTVVITSLAAQAAPPTKGPDEVVVRMYRDYAWEAVIETPLDSSRDLIMQAEPVLSRYFTKELTGLILQDRRCAARTQEICRLDFSPIWASQDPGATAMEIIPGPARDAVTVSYRYPGDNSRVRMVYRLRETGKGWRIADIEYESGKSLRSILK